MNVELWNSSAASSCYGNHTHRIIKDRSHHKEKIIPYCQEWPCSVHVYPEIDANPHSLFEYENPTKFCLK